MAKSCSHYGKGKRKEISLDFEPSEIGQMDITSNLPGVPQEDSARLREDEDEDPQDVIQQLLYERPGDLSHFVDDVEEGEAGPGPSTTQQRHQRITDRLLNDEADMWFQVIEEDAGKIIRMDNHLHQRWHQLFNDGNGNEDKDGDSVMADPNGGESQIKVNPYAPFDSELNWRIARWIIKDNVGHKSLDRLLAIPGVSIIVIAHYHY